MCVLHERPTTNRLQVCVCVCVYMCVSVCVCVCVCVCCACVHHWWNFRTSRDFTRFQHIVFLSGCWVQKGHRSAPKLRTTRRSFRFIGLEVSTRNRSASVNLPHGGDARLPCCFDRRTLPSRCRVLLFFFWHTKSMEYQSESMESTTGAVFHNEGGGSTWIYFREQRSNVFPKSRSIVANLTKALEVRSQNQNSGILPECSALRRESNSDFAT